MPAYVHPDAWTPVGPEVGDGSYPFVAPSRDVRRLVADVALAAAGDPGPPPYRLTWLYGSDAAFGGLAGLPAAPPGDGPDPTDPLGFVEPPRVPLHAVDVVVRNAAGGVAFDSTAATGYAASDHGPYLRVHRWVGPGGALRLTQRTRFPTAASAWAVPPEIRPASAVLDVRATSGTCRRVTGASLEGGVPAEGAVAFKPGYNVAWAATPTATVGIVRASALTFSAAAGSGLGRAPCVEVGAAPTVAALAGAAADPRGRIALTGDPCYSVTPDAVANGDGTATVAPGRLRLTNHCGVCCSCAGYVASAAALVRAHARLETAAAVLSAGRDGLAAAGARWTKLVPPGGAAVPIVRIRAVAYDVRFVDVVVTICNRADSCLSSYSVDLTVAPPSGSPLAAAIVADGVTASATCGSTGPAPVVDGPAAEPFPYALRAYPGVDAAVALRFAAIQPRSTAEFRLRYVFANVDSAAPTPVVFALGHKDGAVMDAGATVSVPPRPEA